MTGLRSCDRTLTSQAGAGGNEQDDEQQWKHGLSCHGRPGSKRATDIEREREGERQRGGEGERNKESDDEWD